MAMTSIGDLAGSFVLNNRSAQLRQSLARLSDEMASGRSTDAAQGLDGQFGRLAQIERDLALAAAFETGAREVQTTASTMQTALDRVAEETDGLVDTLALATTAAGSTDVATAAADGEATLAGFISALNVSVAGRHVFSGTAVGARPLASAETVLTELRSVLSTAVSPENALSAADAFFGPGGGFETVVYNGAGTSLAPVRLGAGESAHLDLRADHGTVRETLKYAAVSALAGDPSLAMDDASRRDLLAHAMDGLLGARDSQAELQADLGFAEERIENAGTRIASEISMLRIAREELLGIDPYETATSLEAVQLRIEALYTVTARMQRLSLLNFLP